MNRLSIGRFPPLNYACSEAMNTLCTNLSFSGENIRKIVITSCHAAEGKSYLAINIMRMMAKLGKSVVLVDADLRRSTISSRFNFQFSTPEQKWGLAHFLAGKVDIDDIVYQTDIEGAYIVPVGREVSNPLPLLNSFRFEKLLNYLAQQVDYVIVDAPPVGVVIDAAQIAKSCDGALIAVSYNMVHRQELIDVKEQLEQTECPILGVVLNMVEYDNYLSRKYSYKSYYSHYGYYENASRKGRHERNNKQKS